MNDEKENLKRAFIAAGLSEKDAEIKASTLAVKVASDLTKGVPSICPRCKTPLKDVQLVGGRMAKFCPVDRITLPVPFNK